MKKSIFFLAFSLWFLFGCSSFIKVTRTVTKTVNFNYNINQIGNFSSIADINGTSIINLFAENDGAFASSKIEKIDIQSVLIGANVLSNNTAKQVQIGATIQTYDGTKTFLDGSKVLQIQSDPSIDFMSALGNAFGADKNNITLHNAIDIVNAAGTKAFQEALQNNLALLNKSAITIRLIGNVPSNQRIVMNVAIQVAATITYSRCEDSGIPLLGASERCIN